MTRVVILGSGGHGREIAEILCAQAASGADIAVLGFIDEDPQTHGERRDTFPILGDWSWFDGIDRADIGVVPALGSPSACRRVVQRARELGLALTSAISPFAHVSPLARLGDGVALFPYAVVTSGAAIGDATTLNISVSISHDSRIGPYCNVNPGVRIAGNVQIGEGCYVGMGTNIIQHCSIGPWSVIGAGAVVIRDLPARVTAVGVPAKVIKQREGEIL